jgi:hypothetical protein
MFFFFLLTVAFTLIFTITVSFTVIFTMLMSLHKLFVILWEWRISSFSWLIFNYFMLR